MAIRVEKADVASSAPYDRIASRCAPQKREEMLVGDQAEGQTPPFKICTLCGTAWPTRDDFLADPHIKLLGYSVHFKDLELGLFLFNHSSCLTTLAIKACAFTDLYEGPIFTERATGTASCPGYCLHQSELRPCPARCECAYVREVVDKASNWNKACG